MVFHILSILKHWMSLLSKGLQSFLAVLLGFDILYHCL